MRRPSLRERLLSRTVINWETGCWEWTASKSSKGYGMTSVNGRNARAHRVAYELIEGPIPAGLQLDHLCRNRACINPAHLEPVTSRENTMRSPVALAALNAAKTRCPAGHELTVENTWVLPRRDGRTFRLCRACRLVNRKEADRAYRRRRRGVLLETSGGAG